MRQRIEIDRARPRAVRIGEWIYAVLMGLCLIGASITAFAAPEVPDQIAAARTPQAPDAPAADATAAKERARRMVASALQEVRTLRRRTPEWPKQATCALRLRPESWLHKPGLRPDRRMSVAASLSAAAKAMGFTWSHALPQSMIYLPLDFGPQRQAMTGADWLCTLDKLTGGAVELQFYPDSRHLFAGEAVGDPTQLQEEEE